MNAMKLPKGESCGFICESCKDKSLYYTLSFSDVRTGLFGCKPTDCNKGDIPLRIWHTHPQNGGSDDFSDADKSFADKYGIPIDVLGPTRFNSYIPKGKK